MRASTIIMKRRRKKPKNLCAPRDVLEQICLPCLTIIKSWLSKKQTFHMLSMLGFAFGAVFTWSRRTTRAKDHGLFYRDYPQSTRSENSMTWVWFVTRSLVFWTLRPLWTKYDWRSTFPGRGTDRSSWRRRNKRRKRRQRKQPKRKSDLRPREKAGRAPLRQKEAGKHPQRGKRNNPPLMLSGFSSCTVETILTRDFWRASCLPSFVDLSLRYQFVLVTAGKYSSNFRCIWSGYRPLLL